jgi:hypothetical protein
MITTPEPEYRVDPDNPGRVVWRRDAHSAWTACDDGLAGLIMEGWTRLVPAPPAPRVWFDGDQIPAATWVYKADGDCVEPDDRIEMLDAYESVTNGNHGPLVEVVLPDVAAIVEAAEATRD